jgi:hypothetical protein
MLLLPSTISHTVGVTGCVVCMPDAQLPAPALPPRATGVVLDEPPVEPGSRPPLLGLLEPDEVVAPEPPLPVLVVLVDVVDALVPALAREPGVLVVSEPQPMAASTQPAISAVTADDREVLGESLGVASGLLGMACPAPAKARASLFPEGVTKVHPGAGTDTN